MQKRLLSALVGIALLMTLCMNVLATYADGSANESAQNSLTDVVTLEDATQELSAATLLNTVCSTVSTDELQQTTDTKSASTKPSLIINEQAITDPNVRTTRNGVTYVSIRTIVEALDSSAVITNLNNQFTATGKNFRLTARIGDAYVVVNDRYLYVPNGVIFQDDATMAPIRVVCNALGATTQWDVMTGNVTVKTTGNPISSGSSYYNSNDVYWLSHIINAESRNQPFKGKIAVGTVIMNRVESGRFPNSIHSVIFSGNQFSPVQDGSIYKEPSTECVIVAKLVLDGAREAGDSLFFNRADLRSWASRNKTFVTTIADHSFFI